MSCSEIALCTFLLVMSGAENLQATSPAPRLPPGATCGIRPILGDIAYGRSRTARVVGGSKVDPPHSWPWFVALIDPDIVGFNFCGGTLIDHNWVVTTAHCADGSLPSQINVRVGEHNLHGVDRFERVYEVDSVYVHESYDRSTIDYDIALLHLKTSVEYNAGVFPVCLPDPHDDFPVGLNTTVIGLGVLSEGGTPSDVLMEVTVPIVKQTSCIEALYFITDRMLCAGLLEEGGKDSCQGDSGGPLMSNKYGVWKLAGIVSWGYGCARITYPGVYTRVTKVVPWIRKVIGSH